MQTIQFVLNDLRLEQKILALADKQHLRIDDFIVSALRSYVAENENSIAIDIPSLNPFQHSRAPTEKFREPHQTSLGLAFDDINNTTDFAQDLRKRGWQRNG
ncbi:MAG: hypothetical protein KAG10_04575 [Methylococcales bacterium]|nr:hypothetical protein [Methylococcales bacterium]